MAIEILKPYHTIKRQLGQWRTQWYMALVFCFAAWFLTLLIAAVRLKLLTRPQLASSSAGNILLWTPVIEHLVGLLFFWALVAGFNKPALASSLPLKNRRKLLPALTAVVLVGLAIYGINYLFSSLGWLAESPFWAALMRCRVCTWAYVIDVVAVAPVVEEVFFRGLLFKAVEDGAGRGWAIIFSSLGFLLFHLVQSQWRVADLIIYLIFAVGAGWLRAWSGSLWPGWVAHVINNLIVGIGLLRS